jgi:LysR family transcriptional regulator, pca operon transcriptional activator
MPGRSFTLLKQRLRMSQLRMAVAIADHGSVLKASRALGVTQPAASRSLLDLEDYLGVRIFDRLARGVALTRYGEAVVARARRVLAEVDRIGEDLTLIETGMLEAMVVGVLPSAATGLMPQVLTRFNAAHPGTTIQIVEGRMHELLALLGSNKIDLIVGRLYEPVIPDSFIREPLYDEPLSLLARYGHPLFNGGRVDAHSLKSQPFVLPTLDQRLGQDVEMAMRSNRLRTEAPVLRASSMSMIRELLMTSDRVSILSSLTMIGDLIRGSLRGVPYSIRTEQRPGGIVRRQSGPARSVDTLRQIIVGYVEETVTTGYLRSLKPSD